MTQMHPEEHRGAKDHSWFAPNPFSISHFCFQILMHTVVILTVPPKLAVTRQCSALTFTPLVISDNSHSTSGF